MNIGKEKVLVGLARLARSTRIWVFGTTPVLVEVALRTYWDQSTSARRNWGYWDDGSAPSCLYWRSEKSLFSELQRDILMHAMERGETRRTEGLFCCVPGPTIRPGFGESLELETDSQ